MEKKTPLDRLRYSGSFDSVIDRICDVYEIGKPRKFSVIEVGFEDCNVIIETTGGKYVAKIFSKDRNQGDIARYGTIMEKVVEAGVSHPRLIKTADGKAVYRDDKSKNIQLVLMDFIEGKSYFDLDRAPTEKERQAIVEQAAKINRIDHRPPYIFDSWAIPNIHVMFDKVKKFVQPEDLKLVEQVMGLYDEISVEGLPHCFVHGDFTKANVMKGDDGKIYILDFSVSNWYPRIQELAVIAANLLHKKSSATPLRVETDLIAKEYSKLNPLTTEEKRHLYSYALAGVAMEFMGAHSEKYLHGNDTEEANYWLKLGRDGLRKELLQKKT